LHSGEDVVGEIPAGHGFVVEKEGRKRKKEFWRGFLFAEFAHLLADYFTTSFVTWSREPGKHDEFEFGKLFRAEYLVEILAKKQEQVSKFDDVLSHSGLVDWVVHHIGIHKQRFITLDVALVIVKKNIIECGHCF
jgi:hypothetical protein